MQLATVGLLLIRERQLLLAFSIRKQCFYLPGGKIDKGETAKRALVREIEEELSLSIKEEDLRFYTHITAPAFGETKGMIMEQDCFILDSDVTPVASAEIGELRYFTSAAYQLETHRAPGAVLILEQLKASGLID
jgi:8-oxo-dGTP pyrophosphatase MutT (NUDIX family)